VDINASIKYVAKGYIDNLNISNFMFATYTGGGIKVDNKPKAVDMTFVIIPQHLTDYDLKVKINGAEQTIKVKNKLEVGDRLIVGQATGAQKYFILDRV